MDATDKYAGAVVGLRLGPGAHESAGAAHASASVDELLQGDDGATLLAAHLDLSDGSLRRVRVSDVATANARVIQMGQMASMLRDTFRCDQYARAIGIAVEDFRRIHGWPPRVLDIGAGTGLLSLLATRSGAASVTGVEQWPPMCAIAASVVAQNAPQLPQAEAVLQLRPLHSSALTLGPQQSVGDSDPTCHVGAPFDLVVSEIIDSALLGEGMVPALSHAFAELCSADAVAVPSAATVWAQLVNVPVADLWHSTDGLNARGGSSLEGSHAGRLGRSDWSPTCSAPSPAIPVHVTALAGLVAVSNPFPALACDFSSSGIVRGPTFLPPAGRAPAETVADHFVLRVPASSDASLPCNAVLFWWDLELCPGVHYSTAPGAADSQGWQDHWVQCLQPLPRPVSPGVSGSFAVAVACPGSTRMSFCVAPGGVTVWPSRLKHRQAMRAGVAPPEAAGGAAAGPPPLYLEPAPCTCGVHTTAPPDRRWMLRGDSAWTASLAAGVDAAVARVTAAASLAGRSSITMVTLGDSAVCGVLAASSPALRAFAGDALIVTVETSVQGAVQADRVLGEACSDNAGADSSDDSSPALRLQHAVCEWDTSTALAPAVADALCAAADPPLPTPSPIDLLLVEPYFSHTAQRPLWALYAAWSRCRALAPLLAPGAAVVPAAATVYAQAVRFSQLHLSHGPAGSPCGLDHAPFDTVQAGFAAHAFAYPLWQYEHALVGAAAPVLRASFRHSQDNCSREGAYIPAPGGRARVAGAAAGVTANAVVLFVGYEWQQQDGEAGAASGEDTGGAPGPLAAAGATWQPGGAPSPWRQDVVFLRPSNRGDAEPPAWLEVALGFSAALGQPEITVTPDQGAA